MAEPASSKGRGKRIEAKAVDKKEAKNIYSEAKETHGRLSRRNQMSFKWAANGGKGGI